MAGDHDVPVPRTGFSIARRGYDQAQVDGHLRRLDAEVRMLAADRDAAVAQNTRLSRELDDARSRTESMQQQVNRLSGPPQSVQGMSERLRSMLRLAEDEVAEMHHRAEREIGEQRRTAEDRARDIITDARSRAEHVVADAEAHRADLDRRAEERDGELDAKQARVERELAELRETTEAELAELRADTERSLADRRRDTEHELSEQERTVTERITRADAEAQEHRERIDHDFRIAMDQRRAEALTALFAERDALTGEITRRRRETDEQVRTSLEQARTESEQLRQQARRDAADAVERARHEVDRLMTLRARVAEQLRATRQLIGTEVDGLDEAIATRAGEEGAEGAAAGPAPEQPEPGADDGAPVSRRPSPSPRARSNGHPAQPAARAR